MHELRLNMRLVEATMGEQKEAEIELLVDDNGKMRSLLRTCWNFAEFREWLSDNLVRITQEPLPHFFKGEDSIAKGISLFYESVDPDDDALIDNAFDYREAHGIRFALRGARVADIYIGLHGENLEISLFSELDSWSYKIHQKSFENEVRKIIR